MRILANSKTNMLSEILLLQLAIFAIIVALATSIAGRAIAKDFLVHGRTVDSFGRSIGNITLAITIEKRKPCGECWEMITSATQSDESGHFQFRIPNAKTGDKVRVWAFKMDPTDALNLLFPPFESVKSTTSIMRGVEYVLGTSRDVDLGNVRIQFKLREVTIKPRSELFDSVIKSKTIRIVITDEIGREVASPVIQTKQSLTSEGSIRFTLPNGVWFLSVRDGTSNIELAPKKRVDLTDTSVQLDL